MFTGSMFDLSDDQTEGRRMSPLAAMLMIGGTCIALWSVIVSAAVHIL
jgi:hypothetical protein